MDCREYLTATCNYGDALSQVTILLIFVLPDMEGFLEAEHEWKLLVPG